MSQGEQVDADLIQAINRLFHVIAGSCFDWRRGCSRPPSCLHGGPDISPLSASSWLVSSTLVTPLIENFFFMSALLLRFKPFGPKGEGVGRAVREKFAEAA